MSSRMSAIGSIVAAVAVVIGIIAKFMQGQAPTVTELSLAAGVVGAAFGFQKAA